METHKSARARLCVVGGGGSGPGPGFCWWDTRLFLALNCADGIECANPQTHNKPPQAFNSQGRLGRPVTCWRLPNGPDSVRAAGTPGRPEHSAPAPWRKKESCVGGRGAQTPAQLRPRGPTQETLACRRRRHLAAAFWSPAFDKYSPAFAPESDSLSLFSPGTMILDDVT